MNNEGKILSMLDLIASELKSLKDTSVTKDEFKSFREQSYDRFSKLEGEMATFKDETNEKLADIANKLDDQNTSLDAQFNVLNERLFKQEAQVMILRKKRLYEEEAVL